MSIASMWDEKLKRADKSTQPMLLTVVWEDLRVLVDDALSLEDLQAKFGSQLEMMHRERVTEVANLRTELERVKAEP